jgi:hypothetical protein
MNKIYAFAAALLLACSNSNEFHEKKHMEVFIEFDYQVVGGILYLYEYLYAEGDIQLQNFFWVIDSDTIFGEYRPRKISYGEHFIQLSLIDIWGDTISYSETIPVKEPLSITLLSPVNGYSEFSVGDTVIFEYKVNDEEIGHAVYACQGLGCAENDSIFWTDRYKLRFKAAIIPDNPVFWGVMTSTGYRTKEKRSIWPKK